ncbi:MAG: toprim domain-containing protein [Deltaproteobacteria bacterium]|nr:MAG: toprim domain-containing protein [Deltaproteobacteria bacterium]
MKIKDVIKHLRKKVDLLKIIGRVVELKKRGKYYMGLCPFHAESKPSFVVSDNGFFKCYGCGAFGDGFTFLEKHTKQSFVNIVKTLAHEYGVQLAIGENRKFESETLEINNNKMQICFKENMQSKPLDYLVNERRYPISLIRKFGIGYGGNSALFKNRITFPIRDQRGFLVAFGGRSILNQLGPKYINSSSNHFYDKSKILYGLYESIPMIKKNKMAVLVEGYFDVIALRSMFIPAISSCGIGFSKDHADLLWNYTDKVILCLDQDISGQKAYEKNLLILIARGFTVYVAKLERKDPDEMWQEKRYEELKMSVLNASDALIYQIQKTLLEGCGGVNFRICAIRNLLKFIRAIKDPFILEKYLSIASDILQESKENLVQLLKEGFKQKDDFIVRADKWTDAEKLLLQVAILYPELIRERHEVLDVKVNSELSETLVAICSKRDLLNIETKQYSDLAMATSQLWDQDYHEISYEFAQEIIEDWIMKGKKKGYRDTYVEIQKGIYEATKEKNLEKVLKHLKIQNNLILSQAAIEKAKLLEQEQEFERRFRMNNNYHVDGLCSENDECNYEYDEYVNFEFHEK